MTTQFIEVKKVIQHKATRTNTGTQKILINIDEIKGGRPWHKKDNDVFIKGHMTMLILKDNPLDAPEGDESRPARIRTMLIEEDYNDFKYRLGEKVPVKIINDDPTPAAFK